MPDFATLIGLAGALWAVGTALASGEGGVQVFINTPSLMIVIAGSISVVLMKFGLVQFLGAVRVAFQAFFFRSQSPTKLIEHVMELANLVRREGMLALEEVDIRNPFLKKGVEYLVDNIDPGIIKATLNREMYQAMERHENGRKIFKALGDVGPAMGMIGTLIGLVQMLTAMDDPKSIGPAMAVALLTTLYGAMLANMFALPIADKLGLRNQEERVAKMLIIDSILGIHQEMHPRILEESLKPYVARGKRDKKKGGEKEDEEEA